MKVRAVPLLVTSAVVAVVLAAGALVAVRGTGDRQSTVPSVAGKPLAAAEATLAADGFHWTVVHLDRGLDVAHHPGTVLGQSPDPETRAGNGSTVHLSVWLALTNGPDVRLPDLVRLAEWQAYDEVVDRGLTATVRGPSHRGSSDYQYWTIVSQSPAPGTTLPIGSGHVTITMQEPPAVRVTARIPTAECAFVQAPGVHLVAAFVVTSAQLREPPIADGGPLGRQAPGSEWRMCYVVGRNVDAAFGGPAPLALPGSHRAALPPPIPAGPRRAVCVFYRSGALAEVVGLPTFRFDAVEGAQPAWRFPWLREAHV